jgi:NADPH2:quinone reductase
MIGVTVRQLRAVIACVIDRSGKAVTLGRVDDREESTMRAIIIHQFGGAEQLHLEEIEKPRAEADEVLIRNVVAGINYADIMLRRGEYLRQPPPPVIPGFEAAGIIEAVGTNASDWRVGQRVLALVNEGGYAEYVVAKISQLVPVPDGLDFGHATALLIQGLTAIALLRGLQPGQTVLIHAAAGGVGSLLVQLAKHKGARVIGTASSSGKLKTVLEFGADMGINYGESDWVDQILQATENKGADLILEMAGGEIGRRNLKCLATYGTMIVYGAASGEDFQISALSLLAKMQTVKGYYLTIDSPSNRAQYAKELMEHINAGRLRVMVTELPIEQAMEAHRAIENRRTMGKIVLSLNSNTTKEQ